MDLGLGNMLGGISSGQIFSILGMIISFVAILIGAAALFFLVWYIKAYNIEIEYFDRRNNSNRLKKTWGRKIIEDGIPKLKIWVSKNKTYEVPDDKYVFSKGKKDKIYMVRNFDGNFKAIGIDLQTNNPTLEEVPIVSRLWESLTYRKNFERFHKQSFFEKYGHLIIQYGFIMVVVVLLVILFTKFQVVADSLNAAVTAAQQCQRV